MPSVGGPGSAGGSSYNLESLVTNACSGGPAISDLNLDKIITELRQGQVKDVVSQAEVESIQAALQRMVASGSISADRASDYANQIRAGVQSAVNQHALTVEQGAQSWMQFNANSGDDAIRRMAQDAAGGHFGLTRGETRNLLDRALANDGTISLNELNSIMGGIQDAFKAGKISAKQRDHELRQLRNHVAKLTGKFGPFKGTLTPEAQSFVKEFLGKRVGGLFAHHYAKNITDFAKAAATDGKVSPAERQAMLNALMMDGKITPQELEAVHIGLSQALNEGKLSQAEFDGTMKLINLEVAKYTGGSTTAGEYSYQQLRQTNEGYTFRA